MGQRSMHPDPGRWELMLRIPGGHRYFKDLHTGGQIAIADNSGDTPDDTDDGVLWLRLKEPILVSGDEVVIPLISEDGTTNVAGASVTEALLVGITFGMAVYVQLLRPVYSPSVRPPYPVDGGMHTAMLNACKAALGSGQLPPGGPTEQVVRAAVRKAERLE